MEVVEVVVGGTLLVIAAVGLFLLPVPLLKKLPEDPLSSPRGSSEERSVRRRNIIRAHLKKKPMPPGVHIPKGMFWDELLGEVCYPTEKWAYLRDLEAYEIERIAWEKQREDRASHDTLSFRRPSDPKILAQEPLVPEAPAVPDWGADEED